MQLYQQSATHLSSLLRAKEVSATEILQSVLERAAQVDPTVGAYLHICAEQAMQQAAAVDRQNAAGEALGTLAGLPIGLKDNICTRNIKTTCASRILENFSPVYDATVVQRLKSAGAVITGKLNMDEFAMGSSCENSYFKLTRNPWDASCVPGGSSGGSAAAVAACELPLSLGSDTGGSVRIPASFCGVVGLRPTYGAVSRFGLVAFASSLDQIAPVARTVDDVALLFGAICGADSKRDATSKEYCFAPPTGDSIAGLTIGLPREYFGANIHPEVKVSVLAATKMLESLGAYVQEISLPSTELALPAYNIISSAEASSNLARYDGVKYGFAAGQADTLDALYVATRSEGFGDEVKRRILLGTYVLSSGQYDRYYRRAKLVQRQIAQEFAQAFATCDLLITPTTPFTAFAFGEKKSDPLAMCAVDACTAPASLAGLPALSLPCGLDAQGLPVGLQMIGAKWSESRLLQAAKAYETAVGGFKVGGVTA